jgi:hypothetical protein
MKIDIDFEKILSILIIISAMVSIIIHIDNGFTDLIWQFTTIILGISSWYKKNKLDGLL